MSVLPLTFTPTSLSPLIVNVAVSSSFSSLSVTSAPEPSIAFLSIFTVEILSVITMLPFLSRSTSPVVADSPSVNSPLEIVNSNVETTVNPSGALSSIRVYVPSFRPSMFVSLPVNVYPPSTMSSSVRTFPATVTPTRSLPMRMNVAF